MGKRKVFFFVLTVVYGMRNRLSNLNLYNEEDVMQSAKTYLNMRIIISLLAIVTITWPARAGQPEPVVECNEGSEPIPMNYGEHTSDCSIELTTDLDSFSFIGSEGEIIRVSVDGNSNHFDPRLEIRGPEGTVIVDTYCEDSGYPWYTPCSFSVEESLTVSGEYTLAISDQGVNDPGDYILQLERLHPSNDPLSFSYNFPLNDDINPTTDMDFIAFEGEEGTEIRIIVDGNSNHFDPRLEIWDPEGTLIEDTYCNDSGYPWYTPCSFLVEKDLTLTGTYVMSVSDKGVNDPGNYQVSLQCLYGDCPINPPSSLTISPAFGKYFTTQNFDLGLIVEASGARVVGGSATVDGMDITQELMECLAPHEGTLLTGGQTFRCPDLEVGTFSEGNHTLDVTVELSNGSSLSDILVFEVKKNTEP
jgi:hypothetical protein